MVCSLPEAVWFGTNVQNLTSRSITFAEARLGQAEGAALIDTIPEIIDADGDYLLLGSARDLATDVPELWAVRQPVAGFVLQPGQNASIGFQFARASGADVADVTSQDITYRVDGELFDRTTTSRLRMVIASDCDAIE